jgi:WD40 repeat protein
MLDIAIQFAWGLHYIHELGLIHQDVKPDNVMITNDGIAKLTDFGIAQARTASGDETTSGKPGQTLLVPGVGFCTRAYASPEQLQNVALSRRTDLWSWAVSVLEMFTGNKGEDDNYGPLWSVGSKADTYLNARSHNERIPQMPLDLSALLRRCFQRQASDRPGNLKQLTAELTNIYQKATGTIYPREMPETSHAVADTLNNRGVSLSDLGKRDEATVVWTKALEENPSHLETLYNLNLSRWRSGELRDAELVELLRQSRISRDSEWLPYYLEAQVHLERGDCEAAITACDDGLDRATEASGRKDLDVLKHQATMLSSRSRRMIGVLEGHHTTGDDTKATVHMRALACDPQGHLASGGSDHTVRVWNLASGKCMYTLQGHEGSVNSIDWSSDGARIVSGSSDRTVRLWDTLARRCVRVYEHESAVVALSISPDGVFALSGSFSTEDDNSREGSRAEALIGPIIKLWNLDTGVCVHELTAYNNDPPLWMHTDHVSTVTAIDISPNGQLALFAGGWDKNAIFVFDMTRRVITRKLEGHTDTIHGVTILPDGRQALSISQDNYVRRWDIETGACLGIWAWGGQDAVAVSSDGRLALSGRPLTLWEVSTGRCLRTFDDDEGWMVSVTWSVDRSIAVTGYQMSDEKLRLWRLSPEWNWRAQPMLACPLSSASTYQGQADLAEAHSAFMEGRILESLASLKKARSSPGFERQQDAIDLWATLCLVLPRGSFRKAWLVRKIDDWVPVHEARFGPADKWVLSKGVTTRFLDRPVWRRLYHVEGHEYTHKDASFSPDGKVAIVDGPDGQHLLDLATLKFMDSGEIHGRASSAAWSPDGRLVLLPQYDHTIRLLMAPLGRCLRTLSGHSDTIDAVKWSSDGTYAISSAQDGRVRLWEVSTGRCIRTLNVAGWGMWAICWTPDGRHVLTPGQSVALWDVQTGECVWRFESQDNVEALDCDPTGRWVLAGGKAVTLLDLKTGQCLQTFEGHDGAVWNVLWSAEGAYFLSRGSDYKIQQWFVDCELGVPNSGHWCDAARPCVETFLALHAASVPLPADRNPSNEEIARFLSRSGQPRWTEEDFQKLCYRLACAGYGWLRPEGVYRELERMANIWRGPSRLA